MPERYIKRVLDGDIEAFRFIIKECQDAAFHLSYSILKEEILAKEASQKAFIRAYERLHTFKHQSAFKTWFHRIVVNEAFQLIRKRERNRNTAEELPVTIESKQNETLKQIDEDHLFRKLMAKSRLEIPYSGFEDEIMSEIEQIGLQKEAVKQGYRRGLRLAGIFFLIGLICGIILTSMIPKLGIAVPGINSSVTLLVFQMIFAATILLLLEKLYLHWKKLSALR